MWQFRFGTGFASGVARGFVGRVSVGVVLAGGLAGCSADVMRLDSPASFGFNDGASGLSRPQASMSRSGAGIGSVDPGQSQTYSPPTPLNSGSVRMAALPEPPAATPAPSYNPPPQSASAYQPAAGNKASAPVAVAEHGDAIEVQPGDTLYGLSKRHHVAVSELMSVNALTTPNLKPGQTLYLPAGKSAGRKPIARQPVVASAAVAAPGAAVAAAAAPVAALPAETIARYDGSYTVKKGDNIYGLALQLHVPPAELQQVNNITDVRKVRPGAVLKVPASALAALPAAPASAPAVVAAPASPAVPSVAASSTEPAVKVPPQVVAAASGPTGGTGQPVLLNGERKVATAETSSNDAAPAGTPERAAPAASAAGDGAVVSKLRWPVKGRVIGTFGARPDGTHNDGVNFQVPLGTEVHAAEGGVVAYAGSELKGYGNLILVRHDNGWITAYAHNEEILAKRGDKVKRGQIIAKAGKSGQVDQPQVHFELRQGSKPVDPTPFMEKI